MNTFDSQSLPPDRVFVTRAMVRDRHITDGALRLYLALLDRPELSRQDITETFGWSPRTIDRSVKCLRDNGHLYTSKRQDSTVVYVASVNGIPEPKRFSGRNDNATDDVPLDRTGTRKVYRKKKVEREEQSSSEGVPTDTYMGERQNWRSKSGKRSQRHVRRSKSRPMNKPQDNGTRRKVLSVLEVSKANFSEIESWYRWGRNEDLTRVLAQMVDAGELNLRGGVYSLRVGA